MDLAFHKHYQQQSTGTSIAAAEIEGSPVPPTRGGVPSGGSLPDDFDIFVLVEGKWKPVDRKKFSKMQTCGLIFSPFMIRSQGYYYCGNEACYSKLEDKGDKRLWMHDFLIDHLAEGYDPNWLHRSVAENFNI